LEHVVKAVNGNYFLNQLQKFMLNRCTLVN